MKLRRTLVAALLVLNTTLALAAPEDIDDTMTMTNGVQYDVQLQRRFIVHLESPSARRFGYWGTGLNPPVHCVSLLSIKRAKKRVIIAAKHYLDLCEVNRMWLSEEKGLLILTLEGSDASDSYRAKFVLRGTHVIERSVSDGETQKVLERTTFGYPAVL